MACSTGSIRAESEDEEEDLGVEEAAGTEEAVAGVEAVVEVEVAAEEAEETEEVEAEEIEELEVADVEVVVEVCALVVEVTEVNLQTSVDGNRNLTGESQPHFSGLHASSSSSLKEEVSLACCFASVDFSDWVCGCGCSSVSGGCCFWS